MKLAHSLPYSKKMHVKQAYSEKLSIVDFMTIFFIGGLSGIVGSLLFSVLIWPVFAIACTSITYVLVSPSGESGKKNYQKVMTVIFKRRTVYHSINRSKSRWWR